MSIEPPAPRALIWREFPNGDSQSTELAAPLLERSFAARYGAYTDRLAVADRAARVSSRSDLPHPPPSNRLQEPLRQWFEELVADLAAFACEADRAGWSRYPCERDGRRSGSADDAASINFESWALASGTLTVRGSCLGPAIILHFASQLGQ
jgi:hypothetical protein